MGDFIIRTGDSIQVTIPPPAIVPALEGPVPLEGSSSSLTVIDMSACLLGDELPEMLREPLPYTAPPFTNPGTGMLTVTLQPSNLTAQTRNDKQILIKGAPFTAMFTVETPATQTTPAGPLPDTELVKEGTAQFITTNGTVRAG
jgi:contractile injection system spike tip protein